MFGLGALGFVELRLGTAGLQATGFRKALRTALADDEKLTHGIGYPNLRGFVGLLLALTFLHDSNCLIP